ncbi:endonuclease domain-containing protein [Gordonia sp. CPCC 205333]|uniref:endonuclease domain-containing protein n=1 Tax=Gordonia sp. CPCC 205333 TaxID=3140790 RepID=UPI003AF3D07D
MTADSGVFTLQELLTLGWSMDQIRRATRAKTLIPLAHGWVSSVGADPRVVAAVSAGGALTCVGALAFHKSHGVPAIWIPPGYPETHVRLSKHQKTKARPTGPFRWCQGFGRPLPVLTAVDSIPVALGCAARCLTPEQWIAVVDSVLNTTSLTIPDIQAGMGVVTKSIMAKFDRCDARSQSGTETVARLRLIAAGFDVVVQPEINRHHHADLGVGALLIECDGRLYHSDEQSYRNDRARDRVTLIDRWLTMRLTYDDVLYGWDQALEDIRAVTRADRHRIRRKNDPRLEMKSRPPQ